MQQRLQLTKLCALHAASEIKTSHIAPPRHLPQRPPLDPFCFDRLCPKWQMSTQQSSSSDASLVLSWCLMCCCIGRWLEVPAISRLPRRPARILHLHHLVYTKRQPTMETLEGSVLRNHWSFPFVACELVGSRVMQPPLRSALDQRKERHDAETKNKQLVDALATATSRTENRMGGGSKNAVGAHTSDDVEPNPDDHLELESGGRDPMRLAPNEDQHFTLNVGDAEKSHLRLESD